MPVEPSDEPQLLKIDKLVQDPRLQLRAYFREDVAAEYGENLLKMPPPRAVVTEFGEVFVYDGFHTLKAARDRGWAEFPVLVQAGTFDDALLLAAGANAAHGIRRTPEDMARAVTALLEHPTFGTYSARRIAEICKVSDTFVGVQRRAHEARVNARLEAERRASAKGRSPGRPRKPSAQKIVGKDGRVQTARKPRPAKAGRPVYDYPNFEKAVGNLKRELDRLYAGFGKVSAGGAVVKDDPYREMADHLARIVKTFKEQYRAFSKSKAPEEA